MKRLYLIEVKKYDTWYPVRTNEAKSKSAAAFDYEYLTEGVTASKVRAVVATVTTDSDGHRRVNRYHIRQECPLCKESGQA